MPGIVIAIVAGSDFRTTDAGNALERATFVAEYAGERLQAARNGLELPDAPELLADQTDLQLALAGTLVSQVVLVGAVVLLTKQSVSELTQTFRMRSYDFTRLWRPALAVLAAYMMVAGYAYLMDLLDIEALQPSSTVPTAITRDNLTIAIAAAVILVGAPVSEELFFRGFVFSGLLKWGFWPAAFISAVLFTIFHLDPGSLIPFTMIGVLLAWLYYSRGSLLDTITFHYLFNFASFILMLGAA